MTVLVSLPLAGLSFPSFVSRRLVFATGHLSREYFVFSSLEPLARNAVFAPNMRLTLLNVIGSPQLPGPLTPGYKRLRCHNQEERRRVEDVSMTWYPVVKGVPWGAQGTQVGIGGGGGGIPGGPCLGGRGEFLPSPVVPGVKPDK